MKQYDPNLQSGEYDILLPSGRYKVYCEMWLAGGGYTFLPVDAVNKLKQEDMKILVHDHKNVLMRLSKPDGTQPFTHLQPLKESDNFIVNLKPNSYSLYAVNHHLGPYILLETMPRRVTTKYEFGFLSNGKKVSYKVEYPQQRQVGNYFAFFPQPQRSQTFNISSG